MNDDRLHDPHLITLYDKYLTSHDTVGFVYLASKRYTIGTLQRLVNHANSQVRCASVLALGYLGDFDINPTLGQALQDEDPNVRRLAGTACRAVWNRMGDEEHRQRLANIIYLNATKQYQEVIEKTTTLVDDLPSFAEAWYHRGSAWFQVEDFSQAIHDFHQALELNPYQFVAAAAMGDAYLRLEDRVSALDTLRRTLRLNPDLKRVQNQVAELARQVEDE